ncbi:MULTISPECIES: DUF3267 domain-containing protein [Clostridium]|uniref:DUF3267 domain-containing protein n=1 Tax=Clostridium TaxID=1485 RepID=UPI00082701EF|nr:MULTISPECIES: DUF3267 domain-containing protein [Clostridium]PJI08647.1 hypothetical protein CUB90_12580 [Clostridium sp. CT7]
MKFVFNIPKTDEKISEKLVNSGWRKLREPEKVSTSLFMSIPLMLLNIIITVSIILKFDNPISKVISNRSFSFSLNLFDLMYFMVGIFLLTLIHELLHAVFMPNFMKSDKIYLGINFNGGFIFTTEIISKLRFIIISIMPFFIISVIMPVILGILGGLNVLFTIFIIINAAGSSIDILNFIIISQVPRNSMIINNGFETYFIVK